MIMSDKPCNLYQLLITWLIRHNLLLSYLSVTRLTKYDHLLPLVNPLSFL